MPATHTAPPPPPTVGPHPLGSSLRRSCADKLLLGVCGGVARATGTNVTALRLGTWALAVILLPVVVLAYLVTALILPRDDGATLIGAGPRDRRDVIIAVLCTFVSAPLVLGAADGSLLSTGDAVPALLLGFVALGGALAVRGRRGGATATPAPMPPAPADPYAPVPGDPFAGTTTGPCADAASEAPTFVRRGDAAASGGGGDQPTLIKRGAPLPAAGNGDGDDGGAGGPQDPGGSGGDPGGPGGPGQPAHQPPAPSPAPQPRRRGLALPVLAIMAVIPALFAVLVGVGIVGGGYQPWAVMLALVAVVAAGGAVAIAILRPSYLGAGLLVVLAVSIGAFSIGVNQFGPVLDDGLGERSFRPASSDELRPYVLGAGEMTIDLRDLPMRRGSTTHVDARLGFGDLRVIVPKGTRVTVTPDSDATGLTASARSTGASAAEATRAPIVELDVDTRGAAVEIATGNAERYENLQVVASESTGFWGSSTTSDEARLETARERRDRAADARQQAAEDRQAAREQAAEAREAARERQSGR